MASLLIKFLWSQRLDHMNGNLLFLCLCLYKCWWFWHDWIRERKRILMYNSLFYLSSVGYYKLTDDAWLNLKMFYRKEWQKSYLDGIRLLTLKVKSCCYDWYFNDLNKSLYYILAQGVKNINYQQPLSRLITHNQMPPMSTDHATLKFLVHMLYGWLQ